MKKLLLLISLFALTANAQYTKLFDFSVPAVGSQPSGPLITDGTWLYGTTYSGGLNNYGIVYKIKLDGTSFTKLYDFTGTNSDFNPATGLLLIGDTLYGMTFGQGWPAGCSIFKIRTDGSGYNILHSFGSFIGDGNRPEGALYYDGSSYLYGTTIQGGTPNYNSSKGTVFKIKLNGTGYSILNNFVGSAYGGSSATLISDGTYLYGGNMLADNANGHSASISKIMLDGSNPSTIAASTNTINGAGKTSDIVSDGTYFYGIICGGGINGNGTVFKVLPNGNNLTKLFDFGYGEGDCPVPFPINKLTISNNEVYGITYNNLFYYNIGSNTLINLYNFGTQSSNNGVFPSGGVLKINNNLYGVTLGGGANNGKGVLYKYDISTVGLNELVAKNKEVNLFPNPANEILHVELQNDGLNPSPLRMTDCKLEIVNTLGRVMQTTTLQQPTTIININKLPNGIYTVMLQNNDWKLVKKLIIQH